MSSEINTMLSERTIELGPWNKGFLLLCHPQEERDELLHNESKASQPVHYLYKIQDDQPRTDKGGHLSRSLGSFTGHQVSILPHSYRREVLLFSTLSGKTPHTSSELYLLAYQQPQDLHKVTKTISLHCQKIGITIAVSGWCWHSGKLLQVTQDRWTERSITPADMGFVLNHDKCQFKPTLVFTHLGLTFDAREWQSHYLQKVQSIKTQAARVAFDYMHKFNETAGHNQFFQHGSTSSKASLMYSPVLAEANIQVTSQSCQTPLSSLRNSRSPALVVLLHETAV